jgi:hypothetical protein
MAVSWIEALTAMEARLDAVERGETVDAFEPPAVAAPIPADLLPRAEAVVARGEAVQERMAKEAACIRDELRRLPRIAATGTGAARFEVDA